MLSANSTSLSDPGYAMPRLLVRSRPFAFLPLLALLLTSVRAQQVPETPKAALEELLAAPALKNARVGVLVRDGARVLAENEADRGCMTASNMKLFSSALALRVLGPEFRFATRLEARGRVRDGVLEGDLVLVGSGDPSLGATAYEKKGATAVFARMAQAVREAGIREVTGRVLGDASIQKDEFMGDGWDWSYHADWYAAPVSGLSFNENCIDFVFDGTAVGQRPLFRLEPDTGYFEIQNQLRCVPEGRRERSAIRPQDRDAPTHAPGQLPGGPQGQARLGVCRRSGSLRGDGAARDSRALGDLGARRARARGARGNRLPNAAVCARSTRTVRLRSRSSWCASTRSARTSTPSSCLDAQPWSGARRCRCAGLARS